MLPFLRDSGLAVASWMTVIVSSIPVLSENRACSTKKQRKVGGYNNKDEDDSVNNLPY